MNKAAVEMERLYWNYGELNMPFFYYDTIFISDDVVMRIGLLIKMDHHIRLSKMTDKHVHIFFNTCSLSNTIGQFM